LKILSRALSIAVDLYAIFAYARIISKQREADMNEAVLSQFRAIAEAMQTEPTNWQWVGPHMSQRMFGITETRAREYAKRHGGIAREMGA
jgi:hypothetical protein